MNRPYVFGGCVGLLVLAPLIKAGALEWSGLLWTTLALTCLSLTLCVSLTNKTTNISFNWPQKFLALFFVWLSIQYLTGIAQNKNAATLTLLETAGYLAFSVLLLNSCTSTRTKHRLFQTFIGIALFEASYGWWQLFSETPSIFWMPKIHYLDKLTGTFVNANHTAAFLLIALILIATDWLIKVRAAMAQHKPLLATLRQFNSISTFVIVFLFISLLATRSMGALLAATAVAAAALLYQLWLRGSVKLLAGTAAFAATIMIALLLTIQPDTALDELYALTPTFERRLQIWQNASTTLEHCWLLGCGGGSFYSEYPQYRNLAIGHGRYDHAHNDYIEFIFEFGLIGCGILLAFVGSALSITIRNARNSGRRLDRLFCTTAILSSIGLAVHSIVDFPLHIHAYALSYITIILIASCGSEPAQVNNHTRSISC